MIKMLKNNIKTITAFIIGLIVAGATVYAASIASSVVTYDNSTSHLKDSSNHDVTDVQAAIDALYEKINNGGGTSSTIYMPFSNTHPYTDYHELINEQNSNSFVKYDVNEGISLCIYLSKIGSDNSLICFKNDYSDKETTKNNLLSTFENNFGPGSCVIDENNDISCNSCNNVQGGECPKYTDCVYDNENESWDCSSSTEENYFYSGWCNYLYGFDGTFWCAGYYNEGMYGEYGYLSETAAWR